MTFKGILFDIDGTLLNTTELIYQAFEHSLKAHGHKVLERNLMARSMGKSLEDCYLDFAPSGDILVLSQTHNQFQLKNPHLAKVFPDTIKTLKKLKALGIKVAGITNRWKSSGVKTAGVTYGFGGKHVKKFSPDFVIDSISGLPEILIV
jgi:pyrophosphatase PpaX